MKKRVLCLAAALALAATLVACDSGAASSGSSGGEGQSSSTGSAAAGEKVKISYWHHDGAAKTNPIFEDMFAKFMEDNSDIEVEYLGLPADSFFQKYLTAVATNSGPDAYGMRQGELSAMVAQNALEPLDEYVKSWDGFANIEPVLVQATRDTVPDGKLYMLPEFYNHDINWYNVKLFEENGITPPTTVSEFLEDCEKYADPQNGKYFYTIRGNAGYSNTLSWLVNYTASPGAVSGLYNEDGTCIFRDEKFVEALDAYASIYWNEWCSKDSITANYKEMVAEFGSGTSMMIYHNSSSVVEHRNNLGEGNFMNSIPVASDVDGKIYIKSVGPLGASVSAQSEYKDASFRLVAFLSDEWADSYHSEKVGKIPANKLVYEHDWFKNDPYMQMYPTLMSSEQVVYFDFPEFLPEWKEFQQRTSDDLQALFLKQTTSAEVLQGWSDLLEEYYASYQAANG